MSRYKWARLPAGLQSSANTNLLFNIGVNADGTLFNPRGYPEEIVRAAVAEADARRQERRSNASKKAAATRAVRRKLKVNKAADRIRTNSGIGARRTCFICGKGLSDAISIDRGIGPECWQDVLTKITELQQQEKSHV
jgi:Family of unknown function (DUF6011)